MDVGIALGVILGFGLIYLGIYLNGGGVSLFLDLPSLLIVLGGTVASTLINFKIDQVIGVAKLLWIALTRRGTSPSEAIRLLVGFAEKARREGLLAMEEEAEQLDDHFLKKGIRLVVDGTDPETVRQIMDIELTFLEERHRLGHQIFEHMGTMAPAFGMLGTLIGLVIMLGHIDEPDRIGPAMAVALITTFYGLILANLVFVPIAGKLRVKTEEEVLLREVMIEGILSIQAGENPHIVEQKLHSFLPPKDRRSVTEERLQARIAARVERPERAERMVASGAR